MHLGLRPPAIVTMLLALLAGCTLPVTSDAPPVADSTLVEVLVDLHVLNAWTEVEGEEVPLVLYDSVLARHGLDSALFNRTLDYYASHPEEYLVVYDEVIDRLNEAWESTLPYNRAPE